VSHDVSVLEAHRGHYRPQLPEILERGIDAIVLREAEPVPAPADAEPIRQAFPRTWGQPLLRLAPGSGTVGPGPLRVGVVLSGGQAPGGHNVIAGLLDGLRGIHPGSRLIGFLGGPNGILTERHTELTPAAVEPYRNTGGFDMIGSGRDKIETPAELAACRDVCHKLDLQGLVIVGGDDSNTNAAVLAEHFLEAGLPTRVVGVPKTIDGDLKGPELEAPFGFDTAVKVYSGLIGNICRDARSAGKYWHFIRLMGRSASHVTLECALQARPNLALVGEEVRARRLTLGAIVEQVADLVRRRAEAGRRHGVCLVPEGLIEFIPEMATLIGELNQLLAVGGEPAGREQVASRLSPASRAALDALPPEIQDQLLAERDAHGNVQVSLIETESLVMHKVQELLARWRGSGSKVRLQAHRHFLGYEGRCAAPSNFDASYAYGLGRLAALLIAFRRTGYMCALSHLAGAPRGWAPCGIPLTSLMHVESRRGRAAPVIRKALVDLEGPVFRAFSERRADWELGDPYLYPGAIQYFGPPELCDSVTWTLRLESGDSYLFSGEKGLLSP
jgi:pyrophosphate--fructose-6-phosphate 1-phosphotransferase